MSCPHLSPDTIAACTQAAFDYDPACYCVFHWNYADYPPRHKFHGFTTKWVSVGIWRDEAGSEFGSCLLHRAADSAPELLRQLRLALAAEPPLSLPPPPAPAPIPQPAPVRQPGQGWVACAAQTTRQLNPWPHPTT